MTFYRSELPQQTQLNIEGSSRHAPSVCLMREHCAWLLTRYQPVHVGGDKNCLFRSVSRALYDDEVQQVQLRLHTVMERLMSAELYDKTDPNFYQPYKCDPYLIVPDYNEDDCSEVIGNTVSVDPSPEGYANDGTFLSLSSIVNMLSSNASDICVRSKVPNGCKSNVYFVIDESRNIKRRAQGQRGIYWDDCGAWAENRSLTSYHLLPNLTEIRYTDGSYTCRRKIEGKNVTVLMDPQPLPTDVVVVQRYYARLKRDPDYHKKGNDHAWV